MTAPAAGPPPNTTAIPPQYRESKYSLAHLSGIDELSLNAPSLPRMQMLNLLAANFELQAACAGDIISSPDFQYGFSSAILSFDGRNPSQRFIKIAPPSMLPDSNDPERAKIKFRVLEAGWGTEKAHAHTEELSITNPQKVWIVKAEAIHVLAQKIQFIQIDLNEPELIVPTVLIHEREKGNKVQDLIWHRDIALARRYLSGGSAPLVVGQTFTCQDFTSAHKADFSDNSPFFNLLFPGPANRQGGQIAMDNEHRGKLLFKVAASGWGEVYPDIWIVKAVPVDPSQSLQHIQFGQFNIRTGDESGLKIVLQ